MTPAEAIAALPASIRIGPFDFAIVKETMHVAAGRREFGSCNCAAMQISIQGDMPATSKAVDTLLHETLHAAYWTYGIEDGDKEERMVSTISTVLVALHRDNPWLAGWIAKALAL